MFTLDGKTYTRYEVYNNSELLGLLAKQNATRDRAMYEDPSVSSDE
jgi:hypothetical protein